MKSLVFTLALLASVPAFAETYITGQLARVDHKVNVEDVSLSDTSTGVFLAVGFPMSPNFALEAGYTNLGKFSKTESGYTIYAKPNSVYGAVVGTLVATPEFSVSAKVGIARHSTKVGYDDGRGDADSVRETKSGALISIGAAYAISPKISLVAEYTHFGTLAKDDEFNESIKASALSAGVRFAF